MHITLGHGLLVAVVIVLTAIITATVSTYNSRGRIQSSFDSGLQRLNRQANRMRPVKNSWLDPVVDGLVALRLTPNRVTLLGGCLLGCAAWMAQQSRLGMALAFFIPGILMDMFDGAMARRYPERTTWLGKYLDPAIDTASGWAFMLILLPRYHHAWIPKALIGLLLLRVLAYLWYRWRWSQQLGLGMFPKNWSGENKAAFVAVGVGLMLIPTHHPAYVLGSEICLGLAIVFEGQSLWATHARFKQLKAERQAQSLDS